MNEEFQIQLKAKSILNVPLNKYDKDFSFIINGEEFKTSHLVADLLSPTICQIHQNDPTMSEFSITTENQGHFSFILELATFSQISIPELEIPFLIEIIEKLENNWIKVTNPIKNIQITEDTAVNLLHRHEKMPNFFSKEIESDIEFISMHFYQLFETQKESLKTLTEDTLERIISHPHLKIQSEDDLLHFINELYLTSKKFSNFYSYVLFANVGQEAIDEFVNIYDYNDLTREAWNSISNRLQNQKLTEKGRYNDIIISPSGEKEFNGIINFIKKQNNNRIENKIKITSSSLRFEYPPSNVVIYNDSQKQFRTNDSPNSWICFEFLENSIIPTSYQIRSYPFWKNENHPKTWVIEGSMDNVNWFILDSQENCAILNDSNVSHIFSIDESKSKKVRYIKMRQTGKNWKNMDHLNLDCIEFYGKLI